MQARPAQLLAFDEGYLKPQLSRADGSDVPSRTPAEEADIELTICVQGYRDYTGLAPHGGVEGGWLAAYGK
jgi:hypothetical protein